MESLGGRKIVTDRGLAALADRQEVRPREFLGVVGRDNADLDASTAADRLAGVSACRASARYAPLFRQAGSADRRLACSKDGRLPDA